MNSSSDEPPGEPFLQLPPRPPHKSTSPHVQQKFKRHSSDSTNGSSKVRESEIKRDTPNNEVESDLGESMELCMIGGHTDVNDEDDNTVLTKSDRIKNLIDQCKLNKQKKLILSNMEVSLKDISAKQLDIPILQKLGLSGNKLFEIPRQMVMCLRGLRTLDVSQCNLRKIPEEWNLPNLRRLDLRYNELNVFPEEAVFKGIPKLRHLDMYGNKVCEIILPDDLAPLEKLEHLNLGSNNLSHVPEKLSQLKCLQRLELTKNMIEIIPMEICQMDLKELNVSSNPLIKPPIETCERGIGSMKRYYQCLSNEERSTQHTTHSAAQHPTHNIPSAIPPSYSFQDPIRDLGNRTEPNDDINMVSINNTLKVIVVGMAQTGKTTIIKRLTGATIPSIQQRTVGVHIHAWKPAEDENDDRSHINTLIDSYSPNLEDAHIKFSMWDFAGQHVYHSSHEIFFSERALHILVWDMGATNDEILLVDKIADEDLDHEYDLSSDDDSIESDQDKAIAYLERDIDDKVQFWINCIQNCAPGAVILVVATHDDLLEENEARRRCKVMEERVLQFEERRIRGLEARQKELIENKAAHSNIAHRIEERLSNRPKILFGGADDGVVRVSGKDNTGFNELAEKVVNIATGREKFENCQNPIFQGHVGARIPRIRYSIQKIVQEMRGPFKVIVGSHLMDKLDERGIKCIEDDVIDALYFLADIGEISYFGDICNKKGNCLSKHWDPDIYTEDESNLAPRASMINKSAFHYQYIFLNPRWLMSAISSIVRHDLNDQLDKVIRKGKLSRAEIYGVVGQHQFPGITAKAANLLWKEKASTKNAEGRILEYTGSDRPTTGLFEFLQELFIQFKIFVPIDLNKNIEFHAKGLKLELPKADLICDPTKRSFFFLPSLLGEGEPIDGAMWEYKNNESWKDTVCHSILLHGSVPTGLVGRITASVLSEINKKKSRHCLKVKQIHCWQKTLILSTIFEFEGTANNIEIFVHLAEKDDKLCVATKRMAIGTRRLIISGKGPAVHIWNGGYGIVKKAVDRVFLNYKGLDYEEQGICPDCLQEASIGQAACWPYDFITSATLEGHGRIRCSKGHSMSQRSASLICNQSFTDPSYLDKVYDSEVNITESSHSVVLVGLWDGDKASQKITSIGSGFIVDKKRGLIMTTAHTLIHIEGPETTFGKDYFGQKRKVVIGIIPDDVNNNESRAVFRYFAKIVAKDKMMVSDEKRCEVDACILQITTRMQNDVDGDGDACGEQREDVIMKTSSAMRREGLKELRIIKNDCEVNESIHSIGFNQGGEGLPARVEINRNFDVTRGYISSAKVYTEANIEPYTFSPRVETVVIFMLKPGHSGSPCINKGGKVIGMVCRCHQGESTRCYLVPWKNLRILLRRARECCN
eukprot:CAMPEP_0198264196 /NCGR_PEP_ID=MMETSP1447-20131203/14938_1 /TAXON_ID=420782 /ORGANISM="Chaetoceros dichaeta, Strain CCMP1751" /LENGTH=1385 /DNA_ID=CAMNT_0043953057 /DNA_START=109 /DNA_END=4263 /DNA_ORIENTATION=+